MNNFLRILALALLPSALSAQFLEAGIMVGASNYLGDLSKNSATVYLRETKPAFGLLARYNFNDLFAARLGFAYASVSGRDANVKSDDYIRKRNLSFKSNVLELSLIGEVNLPGYQPYGLARPFSPYIFGGISVFKFNPRTRYQGNWEELQPLGTEGQGLSAYPEREEYSQVSLAVPVGLGVKYALSDQITLGLELGTRVTFTDYLDDVSGTYVAYPELVENGELAAALGNRTGELAGGEPVIVPTGTQRGDKTPRDLFFILGATVTYNFIDNGLMGSRKRGLRRAGCKTDF
jgi:opacity protein-like surface antigen